MRQFVASTLRFVPLFLCGCLSQDGGPGEAAPALDVLGRTPADLVGSWVAMWNTYDLDQVGELFLPDERLTYFSSESEGVIRGFGAVMEHHLGFGFVPGGEERGTRLWVEDLTEVDLGEAAVLTAIWYFQRTEASVDEAAPPRDEVAEPSTPVASGASPPEEVQATLPPPQRGPVTFVCVLDGGRWRFAHMNFGNYLAQEGGGSG